MTGVRAIYGCFTRFCGKFFTAFVKASRLVVFPAIKICFVLVSLSYFMLMTVLVIQNLYTASFGFGAPKIVASDGSKQHLPIPALPEYALLQLASKNLSKLGDELRWHTLASGELQIRIVAASNSGTSAFHESILSGDLARFAMSLQTVAECLRNVGKHVDMFLSKYVALCLIPIACSIYLFVFLSVHYDRNSLASRLEMAHMYAKSSLVSRFSFGLLIPDNAGELVKIFAATHENTFSSIQSMIELLKVGTILILECEENASEIDVAMKGMNRTDKKQGYYEHLFGTVVRSVRRHPDAHRLEAHDELLNDVQELIKSAHGNFTRGFLLLKSTQDGLEKVRKYTSTHFAAYANEVGKG